MLEQTPPGERVVHLPSLQRPPHNVLEMQAFLKPECLEKRWRVPMLKRGLQRHILITNQFPFLFWDLRLLKHAPRV